MHRSFAGMWALLVPSYQAKPKRAGGQENRLRLQVRAYPGLGALSAEMVQPHCDHVTGLSVAERELTLRHRLLGGLICSITEPLERPDLGLLQVFTVFLPNQRNTN